MPKSQKLLKSESLNKSNTRKRSSFLTFGTKIVFNCLWLVFTKASILQYFNPENHIYIITDILSYVISNVLSQLTFGTSPDKIIIKADLS